MGMKKPHKEKVKRKRGKKYKYDPAKDEKLQALRNKTNPFEEMSKKKYSKTSNQFQELVKDYKTKNVSNQFIDNRIGEGSRNLSQDEKMKLRYKAQQLLKHNKKNKFLINEEEDEDLVLTHKGKKIKDDDSFDYDDTNYQDRKDDDEYYNQMNEYIEKLESNPKLSARERLNQMIERSKQMKEEKQKQKEETDNKIRFLDEGFAELASMLTKRKREFNKFNDDYDKMANNFLYSEKTQATERVKTEEEIEAEKQNKIRKMNLRRLKEEAEEDEQEEKGKNKNIEIDEDKEDSNEKHLTKKERINKIIQERMQKIRELHDKKKENGEEEEENEDEEEEEEEEEEDEQDDLSDLEELDAKEGEENEEEEGEEEEDEADEESEQDEDIKFLNKINKKK